MNLTHKKGIFTSPHERLMRHVNKTETCWLWTGGKTRKIKGYGTILVNSDYRKTGEKIKVAYVHRISYEKFKGPIPKDLDILHTCDNTLCVNPDHLIPGTHTENMWDMLAKKRYPEKKLDHEDVFKIIKIYKKTNSSQSEIAFAFNINQSHVSRIVNGLARKFTTQTMS